MLAATQMQQMSEGLSKFYPAPQLAAHGLQVHHSYNLDARPSFIRIINWQCMDYTHST